MRFSVLPFRVATLLIRHVHYVDFGACPSTEERIAVVGDVRRFALYVFSERMQNLRKQIYCGHYEIQEV